MNGEQRALRYGLLGLLVLEKLCCGWGALRRAMGTLQGVQDSER